MEVLKAPGPHGPKVYRFKVDGHQFESMNQIITGLELRQLAGLTADTELYVDVPHGWQDHFVSCDDQVDLGKPGTEKLLKPYRKRKKKWPTMAEFEFGV